MRSRRSKCAGRYAPCKSRRWQTCERTGTPPCAI